MEFLTSFKNHETPECRHVSKSMKHGARYCKHTLLSAVHPNHSTRTPTQLITIITTLIIATLLMVPFNYVLAMQQVAGSLTPIFTRNMDSHIVKENTPVGEVIYTLEATILNAQARILYGLDGTQLFSVDKFSGQVKVAQTIDREQTSDQVSFNILATPFIGQAPNFKPGPVANLTVTVFILDENDNPPKIKHVKVGRANYDSNMLERQSSGNFLFGLQSRTPIVKFSLSESTPVGSVVVDLIESIDVDKASNFPLRSVCHDCGPEFELRSANDNLYNDRLNTTIVLVNPLEHVPRNNIRQLNIIVNDGKFNSSIVFEITIEDIQNKPPEFIGSTTFIINENVPIDTQVTTVHAIDGDAIGIDDSPNLPLKRSPNQNQGRQMLYDFLDQEGRASNELENFKLHPLTGEMRVANRLDRESYLSSNGVISLRVRARELTTGASLNEEDLSESILEKSAPFVDLSPKSMSEVEISVIIVDVNDNEPHWLNASEINDININQDLNWYTNLPNDRDSGRIYEVKVKENAALGSPITFKNEMFVYDLDNGNNSVFNITIRDPFDRFDVEPKQVSGFALVTLQIASKRSHHKPIDYENPNERSFIIQLIATETSTPEALSSKAQVLIKVLDVNDNAPEFRDSSYHANIREDAPPGKTVLLIQAYDKDEISTQITYSLHGDSAYLFDINRNSGLITVAKCSSNSQQSTRTRLHSRPCIDYEHQRTHHLMVEASDGELSSKIPLTIFVDDESDNAPVFTLPVIDAVIEEGADRLDPPIKIEATDIDQSSTISYSIVEGNFEGLFSINNATGELQLTRPIRISHDEISRGDDYRQQQLNKMTIIVQATDGSFSTNGTIRIDVLDSNDNAPKFLKSQYSAEIPESASPGQHVVTVRAIDIDRGSNALVSYRIERGSFGQFEIDHALGEISIARFAKEFDSNKRENYTLEVIAYDHGMVSRSSSVIVSIHVQDTTRRVPEFYPQIQRVVISESTFNNTMIHKMMVSEQDAVNPNLIFEPGPIEALDKNGRPVSSSESERLESMFSVATNTGEVIVNSNLDHDFAAYINLTLYVSVRPPTSESPNPNEPIEEFIPRSVGYFIITVVDDNTNPPIFAAPWSPIQPELNYQMAEELPVGSVLTQLVASDVDSKISHFKIEPLNEYFELASPQTGVIINKKLIDYDALMKQTFKTPGSHRSNHSAPMLATGNNMIQFNVLVYDSGVPQLSAKATISVEIVPTNDYDCKFEKLIYEVRVKENAQADAFVTQVRANDQDYGEQHNSIKYQLVGEHRDLFDIDHRTGVVTVSAKGSAQLDRERMSQPVFTLTVVGRDEQNPSQYQTTPTIVKTSRNSKNQLQNQSFRTCSTTIIVHVDDVNDNPPLFSQKLYDISAYDTDAIDVPLVKLMIRDDDSLSTNSIAARTNQPTNVFRILSGNINDSFNITNTGLIYATKPLNETFAYTREPLQLRVQVKQQSSSGSNGGLASFTDECVVRINFVKINRHGPEWRLESLKSVSVLENSKPGTLVTQLKCSDRDYDLKGTGSLVDQDDASRKKNLGQFINPIRYWIKENGSNVIETNEFKLDPVTGNLVTRVELDRESQEFHQLIVTCEDNGKPQSLESITPLYITVLDVDDNKPEFVVPKGQEVSGSSLRSSRINANHNAKVRPTIAFSIEEHQSTGLPVGELKAFDRDINYVVNPINFCLIEGNEFQEFGLDKMTGILYTNQTLDRERQSSYDLLVKAINHDSTCEDLMPSENSKDISTNGTNSEHKRRNLPSRAYSQRSSDAGSYIKVRVEVLDINDNAPIFRRPVYRAGVHHRSLMNSLVTQVAAFDPDAGLNGTMTYRIGEVLMYKTGLLQQTTSSSRKYEVTAEQQPLSKPIKLIQSPFKIDQQGNIYTQQLLTQYQLMSMFELQIEATEQAEPWRTATTKLEIYVYETISQLKIRINLHPRLVESYKSEIETLLSNATRYTAIINRARSYHETQDSAFSSNQRAKVKPLLPSLRQKSPPDTQLLSRHDSDEPTFSNIQLIFVDNYRIVNPNLVMEKFDLTSAQLFTPQLLTQSSANNNIEAQSSDGLVRHQTVDNQVRQQMQIEEVSSLIDKIALASVLPSEYHTGPPSGLAGIDWLESPSVLYATLAAILALVGFIICLVGCCCTSRIKDHIIKVAMNKLVDQQNIQAKINERVLATATNNEANICNQEYLLQQGGFMSSFDATKGCIGNNNDNMEIVHRAMESGEFIDPNYTTLNGRVNLGAHYYDASELEQQQEDPSHHNELNVNQGMRDIGQVDDDLSDNGHAMKQQKLLSNGGLGNHPRQRQQVPQ